MEKLWNIALFGTTGKYRTWWRAHPKTLAGYYAVGIGFCTYMVFKDQIDKFVADKVTDALAVDRFANSLDKIKTPNELLAAAEAKS